VLLLAASLGQDGKTLLVAGSGKQLRELTMTSLACLDRTRRRLYYRRMRGHPVSPWPRLPVPPLLVCALLAVAAGIFISQCLWLDKVLIDDAFITFSFSKNLAAGNGPLYSHGVRAEGYSNFLWMVLVALPLALARDMDPVLAARLVGVPFLLLLGWGTYRLAALATQSRLVGALAVVVLSCATDVASAYLSGLETVAYAGFFVGSFALQVSSWRYGGNERKRALVPWCALGAALTRIDGFMVLGLVVAFELGASPQMGRPCAAGLPRLVCVALLVLRAPSPLHLLCEGVDPQSASRPRLAVCVD
jgi:arabinofuranosyltransferase